MKARKGAVSNKGKQRKPQHDDLRVWWIPQVPMKAFYVGVKDLYEARKVLDVLAEYDIFQFENKVKPDYSNVGGLQIFDGERKEWLEWDDGFGDDIDTTEVFDLRRTNR